jgi:hypothetical protein
MTPQEAVIAEALSWVGPPPWYKVTCRYQHGECLKGFAASCGSFIAAVFNNALGTRLVCRQITEQWYLNAKEQVYLEELQRQGFVEITRTEARPADLIVSRPHNEIYCHGAIIVNWPQPATLIHCTLRGVQRSHSAWSNPCFSQKPETHRFFRWGRWMDAGH